MLTIKRLHQARLSTTASKTNKQTKKSFATHHRFREREELNVMLVNIR